LSAATHREICYKLALDSWSAIPAFCRGRALGIIGLAVWSCRAGSLCALVVACKALFRALGVTADAVLAETGDAILGRFASFALLDHAVAVCVASF